MFAHPVAKRILGSFIANIAGQGITVAQQFLMIPLYFSVWGVHLFGEWTVISTIPIYLGICDFGLGRAAATRLALIAGAGNRPEVNEVYSTVIASVLAFVGILTLLLTALCMLAPLDIWFNLHHISSYDIKLIMELLILGVLFQMAFSVGIVIFCLDNLYAFGSFLNTAQRGFEVAACASVLLLKQSPCVLALTIAAVRLLSFIVLVICVRIKLPWVTVSRKLCKWVHLTSLLSPSIGNVLSPFAMLINLQGMILVVNSLFGPEYVVIFTITRTITRGLLQWTESIKRAVRVEVSIAYGNRDLQSTTALFNKSCRAGFWSMLMWAALLCVAAPSIFHVLVRGKAPFDASLFYSLTLVVVFNSFWQLGSLILDATNEVMRFSTAYLVVSALSVGLSYGLLYYFGFQAAAYGSLVCDGIMIFIALDKSLDMLGESAGAFARFVFLPWGKGPRSAPV